MNLVLDVIFVEEVGKVTELMKFFGKKKTEQNIYCRLYLILNCAVVN